MVEGVVGDIVITQLPYTDLTTIVIRPVLVVADMGPHDWIVCQITSRRQNRPGNIPISQGDMRMGRLRRDSWVRTGRLHTLDESLFGRPVGSLSSSKPGEVLSALRRLF